MGMGAMNSTPRSSRLHIAVFGRRNAGKSSVVNALTRQSISLVSEVAGTTTDPVYKAMEILPIGPVVIIDTAGLDDEGTLGDLRVKRTQEVLRKTDLAIMVIDGEAGISDFEANLADELKRRSIPVVGVVNKTDGSGYRPELPGEAEEKTGFRFIEVSALKGSGIEELKAELIASAPMDQTEEFLIRDLISPSDIVVMVVPIDKAAPKGRLILPQQQVIREALDGDAIVVTAKEHQLKDVYKRLRQKPALIVTDSQAFGQVAAETPRDMPLTSFSILMARQKGDLRELTRGARAIEALRPSDSVLIMEACTHHRQADDIGTVKIPKWLRQAVGGDLNFTWVTGKEVPEDLGRYRLIVHCGGCMLNRKEMMSRISAVKSQGAPIVNYGVLIACVEGILPRALELFPEARAELECQKPLEFRVRPPSAPDSAP